MRSPLRWALVAAWFGVGCSTSDTPLAAPALRASFATAPVSPSYIVQLQPSAGASHAWATAHGVAPKFAYARALHGFAAELSPEQAAAFARHPDVVSVTPDGVMALTTDQLNPPSWNLDRIDQRSLPLDDVYSYAEDGAGVHVYDIDSGIRTDHVDFAGRISDGVNLSDANTGLTDCIGHGTHTAGTIGGTSYGVAKAVTLHPVRVFGCTASAPTSTIVAGVEWVIQHAVRPAVINMSLGGPFDPAMNTAVENAVSAGIVVSVSAGNSNSDACTVSPASAPHVITVGASDASDFRASFSNWGSCVDLYAPGVAILSDWYTSATAFSLLSGTSMAAPHVTGAVARILSASPSLAPADVMDLLARRSTKRALIDPAIDGNLLYTGTDEMAVPPGVRPAAAFTASCVATTCTFTDASTPASEIVAWSWSSLGIPNSANAATYTTTFHYPGTQKVTLTVTGSFGLQATNTDAIVVTSPIRFAITAKKVQGVNTATLTWSNVRGDSVTIARQNQSVSPPYKFWRAANTGTFTDPIGKGSLGTGYSYSICEMTVLADWQCTLYTPIQP